MSALHFLPLLLLLPAVCGASDPNPFLSPEANRHLHPAPNVFVRSQPLSKSARHLAALTPQPQTSPLSVSMPLLPPPLPPPPPTEPARAMAIPLSQEAPAHRERGKSCNITGLPNIPNQADSGGQLTLKIPDFASRCIAGIEAADDWVHIKFFNGRELHLQIDANTSHRSRETNLVFASMTDSQMLSVSQKASVN